MANKRISELSSRVPSASDLMLVGDPTTGYSYKCLVSQVGGVQSVFGRTGAVTAQEGDYTLTQLGDVTITSPQLDQVLVYNGGAWVNTENYSNKVQHYVKLGAAIAKGRVVYVSGASGTNMVVNVSSNDSEATSSKVLGVTATGGALNDMVYVITEGLLPNIDTSGSTIGDAVWLGSNGALIFGVANRPVPPLNAVYIGVVTRVSATVGEIFIRVQNGFELDELHDVKFTSLSNNQALVYNTTTSLWENRTLTTSVVTEGTNLYYTDARARGAISLTTTGSGAATYNSTTGVLNIPTPSSVNLYNSDGTLTGNRTVTLSTNSLTIAGSVSHRFYSNGNVGIGTTTDAGFRLHVNGTMMVQGSITSTVLNPGSIVFVSASNVLSQNTNNFFWDNTNLRLGIGTNSPQRSLDISRSFAIDDGFRLINAGGGYFQVVNSSSAVYQPIISGQSTGAATSSLVFIGVQTSTASPTATVLRVVARASDNSSPVANNVNAISFENGTTVAMAISSTNSLMVGTTTNVASSILTLSSTTRGILLPRMTTTQRNAISSPATGLMVYDTTTNSLDVYSGSAWLDILASDFITIDNTNNRLGVNTALPTYDLHVTGTAQFTGNVSLALSTATVSIGSTSDSSYKLSVDGSARFYGGIRTAQPTGGVSVADWKLGSTATGTFTVDTGMCVEVEIGGTLRKLAIVT